VFTPEHELYSRSNKTVIWRRLWQDAGMSMGRANAGSDGLEPLLNRLSMRSYKLAEPGQPQDNPQRIHHAFAEALHRPVNSTTRLSLGRVSTKVTEAIKGGITEDIAVGRMIKRIKRNVGLSVAGGIQARQDLALLPVENSAFAPKPEKLAEVLADPIECVTFVAMTELGLLSAEHQLLNQAVSKMIATSLFSVLMPYLTLLSHGHDNQAQTLNPLFNLVVDGMLPFCLHNKDESRCVVLTG